MPATPQAPLGTQTPPIQPIPQSQTPPPSAELPITPPQQFVPPQSQPFINSQALPSQSPPKTGGKPKLLIIILIVVIALLVAAIAVAAFLLTRPKSVSTINEKSNQSEVNTVKENKSETKSNSESSHSKDLGLLYDVPKLMNKTKEEVVAILGEPNNGNGWYNYDNDWSISVYYDLDNGNFRYVSVTVFQDPDGEKLDEATIYKALNLTPGSTEYIFNNIKRTGKSFISQVDIYPLDTTEEIIRQ